MRELYRPCAALAVGVEPTGADLYVNGKAEGQDIVVRVENTARIKSGDKLPIRWQLDQALVFDAASGERI